MKQSNVLLVTLIMLSSLMLASCGMKNYVRLDPKLQNQKIEKKKSVSVFTFIIQNEYEWSDSYTIGNMTYTTKHKIRLNDKAGYRNTIDAVFKNKLNEVNFINPDKIVQSQIVLRMDTNYDPDYLNVYDTPIFNKDKDPSFFQSISNETNIDYFLVSQINIGQPFFYLTLKNQKKFIVTGILQLYNSKGELIHNKKIEVSREIPLDDEGIRIGFIAGVNELLGKYIETIDLQ